MQFAMRWYQLKDFTDINSCSFHSMRISPVIIHFTGNETEARKSK